MSLHLPQKVERWDAVNGKGCKCHKRIRCDAALLRACVDNLLRAELDAGTILSAISVSTWPCTDCDAHGCPGRGWPSRCLIEERSLMRALDLMLRWMY